MAATIACLEPACQAFTRGTCLSCHRHGCAEHVGRYLIGRVAYVDLCAACAVQWQQRFNQALPAPPAISVQALA